MITDNPLVKRPEINSLLGFVPTSTNSSSQLMRGQLRSSEEKKPESASEADSSMG